MTGVSIKPISVSGTERIVRCAFDYARQHGRKKVTAVHKANVLKLGDGLFLREVRKVASEFPDVELEEGIDGLLVPGGFSGCSVDGDLARGNFQTDDLSGSGASGSALSGGPASGTALSGTPASTGGAGMATDSPTSPDRASAPPPESICTARCISGRKKASMARTEPR